MSIDLSSLMEEMDSMRSFDLPQKSTGGESKAGRSSSELAAERLTSGLLAPTQSSASRQRDAVTTTSKKKTTGKKKKSGLPRHKTWGECPVDIMADFLSLVESGKLELALKTGKKILAHEPDNPLIKMYLEALPELISIQKAEEKKEKDSDDEAEAAERENFVTFDNISGEAASEDEIEESDSDNDDEGDFGLDGMAEKKVDDESDFRSQAKADSKRLDAKK